MEEKKAQQIQPMTKMRKILTISVLSLALMIIIIDTTLLNVSLGTIIRDFHTDIQGIQWVITAYSLTLAALTIAGGRFGDLFGRKKMFVLGAVIFAVGSFIASISQNVPTMILGESIVEGVGAALMMPATASILVSNFKGRDRALAFGVWGGIAGGAAALGPIVGGFLATYYSWRWGFRINIVIAAILCLGSIILQESRDTEEKDTIDWVGILFSSLGLLLVVFGIIESSRYGWWIANEPFTIGSSHYVFFHNLSVVPITIFFGFFLLGLFILWEKIMEEANKTPLVSMHLFGIRQYSVGVLTTGVLALGQSGIIFSLPIFLQAVRGYNALQTGIALLPMSLTLLVISPLGALLSGKIRPKYLINFGLFVNFLAMLVLRASMSVDATAWSLAPGLILFGVGMGIVMSQISNMTLSAVSVSEAGEASGVNTTLRQIGSSLGSAVIGAVLLSALSANLISGVNASHVIPNMYKSTISQAIGNQTSNVEFGGGAKFEKSIPKALSDEITKISHQATVDANKKALLFGSFFGLLGFLVSLLLPNVKRVERGTSVAAGH